MKVVLSPNPYRDRGLRAAQAAEKILRGAGVETSMCLPFQVEGGHAELPRHIQFRNTQEELKTAASAGTGPSCTPPRTPTHSGCLSWV